MAQIEPFAGILYRVPQAELGRVLAPPYDVIPPAYQDELYARDPRNIVRVILNRTQGDAGYVEAGETWARWQGTSPLPDTERGREATVARWRSAVETLQDALGGRREL